MLDLRIVQTLVDRALEEDLPWGDVTSDSLLSPEHRCSLDVLLKADGVVAGLAVAECVFRTLEPELSWQALVSDGTTLKKGTVLARVSGRTARLLKAERTALNFIQRMSGIATQAQAFVRQAAKGSTHAKVVDTRKTTPNLRYLEKYAVRMGGATNHRYNLSDAVLIKDNHLAAIADQGIGMAEAIRNARAKLPHTIVIEVEVDTLEQIEPALEGGADIIMLDNMPPEVLKKAVALINGRAKTEASGGVNLETIADIAASGVDLISVGALTHSVKALDISLDFKVT